MAPFALITVARDTKNEENNKVADNNDDALNELCNYREKLAEALAVIHEQDRLIHDALMSKLPTCDDKFTDELEMMQKLDNEMGIFSPRTGVFSPFQQSIGSNRRRRSSVGIRLSLDGEDLLKEFLPPASPATISLMKESGFEVMPSETKQSMNNEDNDQQ